MRSAGEPGSREEDTIPVRCRDTWSEGGGFGARLSDKPNMNSTGPVGNAMSDMSAMQSMQKGRRECGPARGESGATKLQERIPARRERRGRKGGGAAPAVLGGIYGLSLCPTTGHKVCEPCVWCMRFGIVQRNQGPMEQTSRPASQGRKASARACRVVLSSPRSTSSMRQNGCIPGWMTTGFSMRVLV